MLEPGLLAVLLVLSHVEMVASADGRATELAVSVRTAVLAAGLEVLWMNLRLELAVAASG